MLKKFEVRGLNNKLDFCRSFNNDLNILTGKNGSGKTTILKLIWYLTSGNIERVFSEINFDYVKLETNQFSLEIISHIDTKKTVFKITLLREDNTSLEESISLPVRIDDSSERIYSTRLNIAYNEKTNNLNNEIIKLSASSVFFPTFRRIEGGFSIDTRQHNRRKLRSSLQDAMSELSDRLSVSNHQFVSSISTDDIVDLLTKRYVDISNQTNEWQSELSKSIIAKINEYSDQHDLPETEKLKDATSVLDDIQKEVSKVTQQREEALQPFSVLSDFIGEIFQDKSIEVTESIKLGQTEQAISSEKLSAGEKQMLSFLCYNALSKNCCIFIDEPELSLHVDWQRLLFPKLLSQSTNNQFIVATHSPFIYSKYPDKELLLDTDRGDS